MFLTSPTQAQVFDSGPSDSSLFTTVVNVPSALDIRPHQVIGGVAEETIQLNLSEGGAVGNFVNVFSGGEVNISGGTVDREFQAHSGSEVNISGGTVGYSFHANSGSEVNITGGIVSYSFDAGSGSEVNISGGTVGRGFRANAGSDVELIGDEFRLNGAEFNATTITLSLGDLFTGTLADGSAFIFSPLADRLSGVTLTSAPLSAPDMTPMVVDAPVTSRPSGLRAGQMLTLQAGGELGENFAVVDATLNINGGILGDRAEAAGSKVNINGGTVGYNFNAYSGSEVNISGGTVGGAFDASSGSEVSVSGGTVGPSFYVRSGSEVNISGGTVGYAFHATLGSKVELVGGEFRLNGADFTATTITLGRDDLFTGTLVDGSTFVFNDDAIDALKGVTVTSAPLPAIDTTPVVVDALVTSGPSGLRTGQTLTLQAGGALRDNFAVIDATLNIDAGTLGEGVETVGSVVNISGGTVGSYFYALSESEINISGGTVGGSFKAMTGSEVNISGGTVGVFFNVYSDSEVNISGGIVGDAFNARSGSVVNISGGSVGHRFNVHSRSEVNISGGVVGDSFAAFSGVVNISGGSVGDNFRASSSSVVNISDGTVGDFFTARPGSEVNISGGTVGDAFTARPGSVVNLFGTEFLLGGVPLDLLTPGEPLTIADRDVIFSGLLADGSAFSFDLNSTRLNFVDWFAPDATLTVTLLLPEPSACVLLCLASLSCFTVRRRRQDSN